jgi:nucleotide-binding universal stress UspA family protein
MTGVIVVGVDGSLTAQKAAESARELAVALGATLHVVTAFDSDRTEVYGTGSDKRVVSGADEAEVVALKVADGLRPKTSGSTTSPYEAPPLLRCSDKPKPMAPA